jgi:hypothetical protein
MDVQRKLTIGSPQCSPSNANKELRSSEINIVIKNFELFGFPILMQHLYLCVFVNKN